MGVKIGDVPTRSKSPSKLMRDKCFERWISDVDTNSPVPRKYPALMVQTLCDRTGATRNRVYRWLRDPDEHPLTWDELCRIAPELGGWLRCMFSVKHD